MHRCAKQPNLGPLRDLPLPELPPRFWSLNEDGVLRSRQELRAERCLAVGLPDVALALLVRPRTDLAMSGAFQTSAESRQTCHSQPSMPDTNLFADD